MPEITEHNPGAFCWVDLATTDQESAKKFYGEIFGWTSNEYPMEGGLTYSMMQLGGKDVAGISLMQPEQKDMGIPPYWSSYISVRNADDATVKAKENGATVLAGPFDVFESGRMSVIQDPSGATICLWQPKAHKGAFIVNEVGAMGWTELLTHDPAAAREFYSKTFNWSVKESPEYTEYLLEGISHAGMMKIREEWGQMPSVWNVYFRVDDCDKSVEKAIALGGSVIVPPTDIPDVGRFAILCDPQGAMFSLIRLSMPM